MRAKRPSMEAFGLRRSGGVDVEEESGGVGEEEESESSSLPEGEEDSSEEETVRSIASPSILSFFSFLDFSSFPLILLFCFFS